MFESRLRPLQAQAVRLAAIALPAPRAIPSPKPLLHRTALAWDPRPVDWTPSQTRFRLGDWNRRAVGVSCPLPHRSSYRVVVLPREKWHFPRQFDHLDLEREDRIPSRATAHQRRSGYRRRRFLQWRE